jgi:hypothetical protein
MEGCKRVAKIAMMEKTTINSTNEKRVILTFFITIS